MTWPLGITCKTSWWLNIPVGRRRENVNRLIRSCTGPLCCILAMHSSQCTFMWSRTHRNTVSRSRFPAHGFKRPKLSGSSRKGAASHLLLANAEDRACGKMSVKLLLSWCFTSTEMSTTHDQPCFILSGRQEDLQTPLTAADLQAFRSQTVNGRTLFTKLKPGFDHHLWFVFPNWRPVWFKGGWKRGGGGGGGGDGAARGLYNYTEYINAWRVDTL